MINREEIIRIFTCRIKKENLITATVIEADKAPRNYTLQLLNTTFKLSADPYNNWFTAFAVLCTYQSKLAEHIIDKANELSGGPILKKKDKVEMIDAISAGAKLSKADAG